jgi:uncharacterized lipoprotein YmbA
MIESRATTWLRPLSFTMIFIIIGACATTSPPVEFYTLSPMLPSARPSPALGQLAIGIGPLEFPEFLDRPQIVSRTGPNRLDVAEFYRWGGSVEGDFLRVLGENLGSLLGTDRIVVYPTEAPFPLDYRITGDVLRFEPSTAGTAVLKARWALVDERSGQVVAVRGAAIERSAGGADYASQVAALSAALAAFSEEIAAATRRAAKAAAR